MLIKLDWELRAQGGAQNGMACSMAPWGYAMIE